MRSKRYPMFPSASALLLALFLSIGAGTPASAAVIFDFSLAANGDVGAIRFQLTLPDYPLPLGLQVIDPTDPIVTFFNSGTPFDPTQSAIGLEITPTKTLIGVAFFNAASEAVLLTEVYPDDFFVFGRTPTTSGLFSSLSGVVLSDFTLATTNPTASLLVTESAVPEPATGVLTGLAVLGVAGLFIRGRRSAGE